MNNWTNVYDEIMSFYFYEPQHIGKKAYPRDNPHLYSNEQSMLNHISNMEVSLNHLFSILLAISPNKLTRLITAEVFGKAIDDDYFYDQVEVAKVGKIMGDATQPDVVMSGVNNRVMIEMKLGSKTSLDQYYKYLLFTYYMEKGAGKKSNYLVYLAKDSMKRTWKEKFTTEQEIKQVFAHYELPKRSKKGNINVEAVASQLGDISKNLNIGFINYQSLYDLLENEITENKDNEILVNLYRGFNQELIKRALVSQ